MANRFTQQFTLKDIFNNKKLKNKLPLINYKEKEVEGWENFSDHKCKDSE